MLERWLRTFDKHKISYNVPNLVICRAVTGVDCFLYDISLIMYSKSVVKAKKNHLFTQVFFSLQFIFCIC
jgi:hypothetical protein